MVRIGNNKHETTQRRIVSILILSMMLQMLVPFVQVSAYNENDCIRMLQTTEGEEIFHITDSTADDTFSLEMQMAISSQNTDGKKPMVIESTLDDRLDIVEASVINARTHAKITDAEISGNKVTATLLPEDRQEWIDEEIVLLVDVIQEGMEIGDVIKNDFTLTLDRKVYRSNQTEIFYVKEVDFNIKKTAEVKDDRNTISYKASHDIPSRQEFTDMGYDLYKTGVKKLTVNDNLIIGSPGLYKFENIKVFSDDEDVTYEEGVDVEINDDEFGFSVDYSEYFVRTHLGTTMTITYDLKTNEHMDKDELDSQLGSYGFIVDGVQEIMNSLSVTMNVKYASANGILESTISDNEMLETVLNTTRNIIVSKAWPEKKEADYINKFVDSVELILLGNFEEIAKVKVNSENFWQHKFEDLPLTDEKGRHINYSVKEGEIISSRPSRYYAETSTDGDFFMVSNKWAGSSLYLQTKSEGYKEAGEAQPESKTRRAEVLPLSTRKIARTTNFLIPKEELVAPYEHYKYELVDNFKGHDIFTIDEDSIEIYIEEENVTKDFAENIDATDTRLAIEIPKEFIIAHQNEDIYVKYNIVVDRDVEKLSDENFQTLLAKNDVRSISNNVQINEFYKTNDEDPIEPIRRSAKRASFTYDEFYRTIDIPVKKEWVGEPLSHVEVNLLQNGKKIDSVILSEENDWQHLFTSVDKADIYNNEYEYTVEEEIGKFVHVYEVDYSGNQDEGFTIKNKRKENVELINIPISKIWKGAPLPTAEVNLYANGEEVERIFLSEEKGWADAFTSLPKYSLDNELIEYTITEEAEGYKTDIVGTPEEGYTITNTKYLISDLPKVCAFIELEPNPEPSDKRTEVKVSTEWIGTPEPYYVDLLADGETTASYEITEEDNWTHTFTDLPLENEYGEEIEYSLGQVDLPDTKSIITGDMKKGFLVTNINNGIEIKEAKTTIFVTKEWVGEPLDKITVDLQKNGEVIETVEITAADEWTHEFPDVLIFDETEDGGYIRNEYEVVEHELENYTSEITEFEDHFTIVNTQDKGEDGEDGEDGDLPDPNEPELPGEKETFDMVVKKKWVGKKLDKAYINFYVNGELEETYTVNEANNWTFTIKDLPVFDEDDEFIDYDIEEVPVEGYTSSLRGSVEEGYTFINTEIAKPTYTDIKVSKIWIGEKLPEAKVSLVANDSIVDTITLTDDNKWTHTFKNVPEQIDGEEVVYSVMEHKYENYDVEVTGNVEDGFVIKNTKKTGTDNQDQRTAVSVTKRWKGTKGDSATVALVANESVIKVAELNDKDGWSYIFNNLPKYDKFNKLIEYTILEFSQEGYETTVAGNMNKGYVVTNTEKKEDNNNNIDEDRPIVRPPIKDETKDIKVSTKWLTDEKISIRIKLLADNMIEDTILLSEKNNWKHTFRNLDVKYKGKNIRYTLEYEDVEDYVIDLKGNDHSGFILTVDKEDEDDDIIDLPDNDEKRDLIIETDWIGKPLDKLVIKLLADDEEIKTVTLTKDTDWSHIFTDLPISPEGNPFESIDYDIEIEPVDGYEFEIENIFEASGSTDSQHLGYTIKARQEEYDPEDENFIDIHVRASWVGRPLPGTVISILRDGKKIDTIILSKDNDWEHTFKRFPKYNENGTRVEYQILPQDILGYRNRIMKVEEGSYVVVHEEIDITEGLPDGYIPDVQTYDGGVMPVIAIMILSVIAFVFIEKKKH